MDHPRRGPHDQSPEVEKIEKNAQGIQERAKCSRGSAELCTVSDELLNIKMGGLREGLPA
jgi:hypothetical protein